MAKKEPDIRPWHEQHEERRGKTVSHPCNTVPAEMHDNMIKARDKQIADLREILAAKNEREIERSGQIGEPTSARGRWKWIDWVLFLAIIGSFAFGRFTADSAPKGTVDAAGYHADIDKEVQKNYGDLLEEENRAEHDRDHWLRNDKAAYLVLGCQDVLNGVAESYNERIVKRACEALNR